VTVYIVFRSGVEWADVIGVTTTPEAAEIVRCNPPDHWLNDMSIFNVEKWETVE
jgi:hypothetical protein